MTAVAIAVTASGCGGGAAAEMPSLSGDDKEICYHAVRRDAMGVLESTGAGDTDELVELTSAVVVGSSDEEDELTMRRAEVWCRGHGYDLKIPTPER